MGTILTAMLIIVVLVAGTRLIKSVVKLVNFLFDKIDSRF